jgi:hypothetical protein
MLKCSVCLTDFSQEEMRLFSLELVWKIAPKSNGFFRFGLYKQYWIFLIVLGPIVGNFSNISEQLTDNFNQENIFSLVQPQTLKIH